MKNKKAPAKASVKNRKKLDKKKKIILISVIAVVVIAAIIVICVCSDCGKKKTDADAVDATTLDTADTADIESTDTANAADSETKPNGDESAEAKPDQTTGEENAPAPEETTYLYPTAETSRPAEEVVKEMVGLLDLDPEEIKPKGELKKIFVDSEHIHYLYPQGATPDYGEFLVRFAEKLRSISDDGKVYRNDGGTLNELQLGTADQINEEYKYSVIITNFLAVKYKGKTIYIETDRADSQDMEIYPNDVEYYPAIMLWVYEQ